MTELSVTFFCGLKSWAPTNQLSNHNPVTCESHLAIRGFLVPVSFEISFRLGKALWMCDVFLSYLVFILSESFRSPILSNTFCIDYSEPWLLFVNTSICDSVVTFLYFVFFDDIVHLWSCRNQSNTSIANRLFNSVSSSTVAATWSKSGRSVFRIGFAIWFEPQTKD